MPSCTIRRIRARHAGEHRIGRRRAVLRVQGLRRRRSPGVDRGARHAHRHAALRRSWQRRPRDFRHLQRHRRSCRCGPLSAHWFMIVSTSRIAMPTSTRPPSIGMNHKDDAKGTAARTAHRAAPRTPGSPETTAPAPDRGSARSGPGPDRSARNDTTRSFSPASISSRVPTRCTTTWRMASIAPSTIRIATAISVR